MKRGSVQSVIGKMVLLILVATSGVLFPGHQPFSLLSSLAVAQLAACANTDVDGNGAGAWGEHSLVSSQLNFQLLGCGPLWR